MVRVKVVAADSKSDGREQSKGANENTNDSIEVDNEKKFTSLQIEYDKMFILLKRSFINVTSVSEIPILEIRERLTALLEHIDQYHAFTFTPPKFNMNDYIIHNNIKVCLSSYCLAK